MKDKAIPTIKEIAQKLNISVSTVSRALHDNKSIGLRTRMRVQKLAKELDYEPNQTAIFFQKGLTYTIGVIVPELSESFFSSAISGIEDMAQKTNYSVLIGQSHDNIDKEKKLVDNMCKHRVDGLLISISKNTINYEHFEPLKKYRIPIVFFDRIPQLPNINYVACNMISGTMDAINYLLKNKHRKIGLINGPENIAASKDRIEGYIQSFTKSRLKYDPSMIIHSDLTKNAVQEATAKLLSGKRKPTAILTFNDYVALFAAEQAIKMKFVINKDICFLSYANLPFSNYAAHPPLASVEQFPYLQGQKATEMLLELLQSEKEKTENRTVPSYKKVIIEPQLIFHG